MNTELLLRIQRSDPAPPDEAIPHGVWNAQQVLEELQRRTDTPLPQRPRAERGWLIAAAAAIVIVVLIGGIGLFARIQDNPDVSNIVDQVESEEPPIEEPLEPEPTTEGDPTEETESLLQDLPAEVEFGTLDMPTGRAEWVHVTGDGTTLPIYGEVVEWPTGYAILDALNPFNGDRSNTRLWVSTDGIDWQLEPLPIPGDVWNASLTLVDGVYWLISTRPASVWRSTDGSNWEELDLSSVIPGAVGLNWDMDYTAPVTPGGLTLVYATFGANFPYADYAPNRREDGRLCDHVRLAQLGPDLFQVVDYIGDGTACPEQPVLRVIETETGLQVVDDSTGEELGEILGADLTDMTRGTDEAPVETLFAIDGGEVFPVEVPWPAERPFFFNVQDAIYAYVSNHATNRVIAWRTDDGRTWIELGRPTGLDATTDNVDFAALSDGRLVAWSRDLPGVAWESTDGLNWQSADLPPLPEGRARPVPLPAAWFANAGWKGSFDDGDIWWIKTGDTWFSLAELGIASNAQGGSVAGPTGVGKMIFIPAKSGRDLWVIRLDKSE